MTPYVLVVDDEADLLTLVRYNLERDGFEVGAAMDGEEGWSGRMDDEGWELVRIPVPEALRTAQFRAGWWFTSDRAASDEGWYIDDVSVFVATDS